MEKRIHINTSNENKFNEFADIFAKYNVELVWSKLDVREIESGPMDVVVHKATQMEDGILVEDTSLEIVGSPESVGINVKKMMQDLPKFTGKEAIWTVLLAMKTKNLVRVFRGSVDGTIVSPRYGTSQISFGFDPIFEAKITGRTLSEMKQGPCNARETAVRNFIEDRSVATFNPIYDWHGPWQ